MLLRCGTVKQCVFCLVCGPNIIWSRDVVIFGTGVMLNLWKECRTSPSRACNQWFDNVDMFSQFLKKTMETEKKGNFKDKKDISNANWLYR